MEVNSLLIEENDDLQDLFSKYGALALEKQETLGALVGDAEPELDIEKGIVKFNDKEFPIQLIGFLDPDEDTWSLRNLAKNRMFLNFMKMYSKQA